MVIHDVHCHFFSRSFFEALAQQRGDLPPGDAVEQLVSLIGWEPPGTSEALADRWIAELDRHGVARAALIASVPGDEDSVAAAAGRHPERFIGFFMLNPVAPDAADRARRAFGELDLRCACLFPAMHRYRLDDERVAKVFEVAAAHPGSAVFVHCGVLSIGVRKKLGLPSPFDLRLGDPLAVAAVASGYPDVPVIVPHFGAGLFREALMAAESCPSIHLDTSSSNGWIRYQASLDLSMVFRQALDVLGSDRLLFGTDSSFFPRGWQRPIQEAQREALEKAGADETAAEKIFHRNFARLFPV